MYWYNPFLSFFLAMSSLRKKPPPYASFIKQWHKKVKCTCTIKIFWCVSLVLSHYFKQEPRGLVKTLSSWLDARVVWMAWGFSWTLKRKSIINSNQIMAPSIKCPTSLPKTCVVNTSPSCRHHFFHNWKIWLPYY